MNINNIFIVLNSIRNNIRHPERALPQARKDSGSNRNKGFTLIELLIYMGLFSIFMVVLTQLFTSTFSNRLESESTATLDQDSSFIFLRLQHTVQNAKAISVPNSTTLTITNTDNSTTTYSLQSNNLVETTGAESDQLNGWDTSVSSLTFTKVAAAGTKGTVQILYTLQSQVTVNSGQEQKSYETTIGARGY